MSIQSYCDLAVWQKGVDAVVQVYEITSSFPQREIYGLASQLRRAAVSIPSNIAEGHARDSTRDFLRHLAIAQGSRAEVETQLLIAVKLGFVSAAASATLHEHLRELGRMLHGLQNALRKKIAKRFEESANFRSASVIRKRERDSER